MGNAADGLIPDDYKALFKTIGKHETAHVALLQSALGAAAVKAPAVDFTAGGKYADAFTNFKTFATLSATFEDLGVAAYKGQAGTLAGTPVLTTALQIHSVEARHAAAVRPLVGKASTIGAFDKPLSQGQVAGGRQAVPRLALPERYVRMGPSPSGGGPAWRQAAAGAATPGAGRLPMARISAEAPRQAMPATRIAG